MAENEDVWVLKERLEESPEDHELRWNVAKMLYAACEYRHALEELQILRNEWTPKANIVRYLAASYYRLGRYDEAVRELRRGLQTWPDELPLLEQLARVLEVSEQYEAAAEAWEAVHKKAPDHPMAASAARRMRRRMEKKDAPQYDLNLDPGDSGINLKPGQNCPKCGAHNAIDAENCWQCQAPIFSVSTPRPVLAPRSRREEGLQPTVRLAAGLVTLLLVVACVYLSLRDLAAMDNGPLTGAEAFYHRALAPSRVVLGVALMVLWPLAIYLALFAAGIVYIPAGAVALGGLFLAALSFWASFISAQGLAAGATAALLASIGILWMICSLKPRQLLGAWALQAVIVAVAALAVFTVSEWTRSGVVFNPVRDIPALRALRQAQVDDPTLLYQQELTGAAPWQRTVLWEESGSPWFDAYAETVYLTLEAEVSTVPLDVELTDGRGARLEYQTGVRGAFKQQYLIEPGTPYTLSVSGTQPVRVTASLAGLAPCRAGG